jgi:DNA-binding transcriptional regulator GbsR (MarR family)
MAVAVLVGVDHIKIIQFTKKQSKMATSKKSSGVGAVGAIKRKIDKVTKEHKGVSEKLRAEKQVKTLTKRLAQKVTALNKAKTSLAGCKTRSKKRR